MEPTPKRRPAAPKAKAKAKAQANAPAAPTTKAQKAEVAAKKKMADENVQLKAKLQVLEKAAAAAAKGSGSVGDEAMAVDSTGKDDDKVVEGILQEINDLSELPDSVRQHIVGGVDAQLERLQQKLEQARKDRRSAHPLEQQLEETELWQKRAAKRAEAGRADLQAEEEKLKEQQQLVEARRKELTELEAVNAKALQEVASLAATFAREKDQAPAPPMQAEEAGKPSNDPPEGFVCVAFAEQKWKEREEQIAQEMARIRSEVAVQSEVPSEAGDLEDDDEQWTKADRCKRKAMVNTAAAKRRDVLAGKVREHLGKVSTLASPFNKG